MFTKLFTKHHIPLLLFHLLFFTIALTNFPFGRSFIGWDGLYPEFDIWLNLQRAFFATWQENYGTGTITGHGFTGTLPHTVIVFLLSLIAPDSAIRPLFSLLCLYLGGLGMFVLLKKILHDATIHRHVHLTPHLPYIALAGAAFYMLNLGTIQIFYIQLETFIGQYASLPWLFLCVILLLEKVDAKRLLLFLGINMLASIQGFIPSLFLSYALGLVLFLTVYTAYHRVSKKTLQRSAAIIGITVLANSVWIVPLLFYQLTNSDTFLNSYNNIASTGHFIAVNKKYGDLADVALLKSYLFDAFQLGDFILRPWIDHLQLLPSKIIGYSFFVVIIVGVVFALTRLRNALTLAFAAVALFFFSSIATDTPPFSLLTSLLREISPFYEQAFRTAFTKFAIGLSFIYSLCFALGLLGIVMYSKHIRMRLALPIGGGILLITLLWYAFPLFQGNLLYDRLLIQLPEPYKNVMIYFADKPDGRIADFPQDCAEGWYAYKWGYFGSGFYWYGIRQPVLSRSFDVWGKANENYYWEIITALRAEDMERVDEILQKYDASWVLYDPNAFYCRNQKSFIAHQLLLEHLNSSPAYRRAQTFTGDGVEPIRLYERTTPTSESYVSLLKNLPVVNPPYAYGNTDAAYASGPYVTDQNTKPSTYYPFRTPLTNRRTGETDFTIATTDTEMLFTDTLPQGLAGYRLSLPLPTTEESVPTTIRIRRNGRQGTLTVTSQTLQITLDGKSLLPSPRERTLGSFTLPTIPLTLLLNGTELVTADGIYRGALQYGQENSIQVLNERNATLLSVKLSPENISTIRQQKIVLPSYTEGVLSVVVPKNTFDPAHFASRTTELDSLTPTSCNERIPSPLHRFEADITDNQEYVRLSSQNGSQCLVFHFPELLNASGYLLETETRHVSGNPFKLTVYNSNDTTYNDEYFLPEASFTKTHHILPPTLRHGIGYSVQLTNVSENNDRTINDFAGMSLWQIPYDRLINLSLASPEEKEALQSLPVEVSHTNPTGYVVTIPGDAQNATLVLNQSFHPGWQAYSVSKPNVVTQALPFLTSTELSEHQLVNNWANGWTIPEDTQTIVIVFLPQYFQFLSFGAIGLTALLLLSRIWRSGAGKN